MASRWFDIHRATFFWPAIEAGTLVSILIVAGGVLVFAELMEMVKSEPHAFDRLVLLAFRNPMDTSDPMGPEWIELIFRDLEPSSLKIVDGRSG